LKALLARKKQFEGPKSFLEYLEGAVGPKDNSGDRKIPSKEQKTESSKNSMYIWMAQKGRAQKTSKKTQSKGRLSTRGAYLRDSKGLSPIFAL
jgi:hypothetical protein